MSVYFSSVLKAIIQVKRVVWLGSGETPLSELQIVVFSLVFVWWAGRPREFSLLSSLL